MLVSPMDRVLVAADNRQVVVPDKWLLETDVPIALVPCAKC